MSTPTIEAYAELQQAFEHFNAELFGGELPACMITLQRERATHGYYSEERFVRRGGGDPIDEIALNPSYFGVRTVKQVLSTLAHEMVHQWQKHYGKPGRRRYHNAEWAAKMESIGLMPSDTGKPGGRRVGERMTHYVIQDGPFDCACEELITTQFTITFLDRFAPRPLEVDVDNVPAQPPAAPAQLSPQPVDVETGTDLFEPSAVEEGGQDTAPSASAVGPVPDGKGGPPPATDQGTDELRGISALLVQKPQENRSNRVKYTCPSCNTNVWGKPNLSLICGADGCGSARFEPNIPGPLQTDTPDEAGPGMAANLNRDGDDGR